MESLTSAFQFSYILHLVCSLRVSTEQVMEGIRRKKAFTERNEKFMEKIMHNSGLGPATGVADGESNAMLRKEGF